MIAVLPVIRLQRAVSKSLAAFFLLVVLDKDGIFGKIIIILN